MNISFILTTESGETGVESNQENPLRSSTIISKESISTKDIKDTIIANDIAPISTTDVPVENTPVVEKTPSVDNIHIKISTSLNKNNVVFKMGKVIKNIFQAIYEFITDILEAIYYVGNQITFKVVEKVVSWYNAVVNTLVGIEKTVRENVTISIAEEKSENLKKNKCKKRVPMD